MNLHQTKETDQNSSWIIKFWAKNFREIERVFMEPNYEGKSYGIVSGYTSLLCPPAGIVKIWKNTVTVLSRATDQTLFLSNCFFCT